MAVAGQPPENALVNRVKVQICGDDYVIRGQASPEHMSEIARLVDARLRELVNRHRNEPLHRLAVLAAFHFADELVRAKRENEELLELIRGS